MNVQQVLDMQRRLTHSFISMDPVSIILIPHTRVKNSTGGYTKNPGPARLPQTFKLISLSIANRPTIVQDGVERVADYALLGEFDAEVVVGDEWVGTDNRRYEVLSVDDGHQYEVKALVIAHG